MSSRRYARKSCTRRTAKASSFGVLTFLELTTGTTVFEAWYHYTGPTSTEFALVLALSKFANAGPSELLGCDSYVHDIWLLPDRNHQKVSPQGFRVRYVHPAYRKRGPATGQWGPTPVVNDSARVLKDQDAKVGGTLPLLLTAADTCWKDIGLEPPRSRQPAAAGVPA